LAAAKFDSMEFFSPTGKWFAKWAIEIEAYWQQGKIEKKNRVTGASTVLTRKRL
jgi:hypothetical protein